MLLSGHIANLQLLSPSEVLVWVESLDEATQRELSPDWLKRLHQATGPDPWTCGFSIIDQNTSEVVGTCAFKSPPDSLQRVEIAYGINEPFRCKGYATDAAIVMVKFALLDQGLKTVIGHTKPENTASERVMAKAGFVCLGLHEDPEDGQVHRWECTQITA